jgi:hypothetical protein
MARHSVLVIITTGQPTSLRHGANPPALLEKSQQFVTQF